MRYTTIAASADLHSVPQFKAIKEQHREPLVRAIVQSIRELSADGVKPTPRAVLRRTRQQLEFGFPWVSVLIWLIPKLIRWWFSDARLQAEVACHEN